MMALRFSPASTFPFSSLSPLKSFRICKSSVRQTTIQNHKLVLEVKEKLETEQPTLPVGRNGRDDEDMIFWFLKDRKFRVEEAVAKLTKAIVSKMFALCGKALYTSSAERKDRRNSQLAKWRKEFGVSELSEESVKAIAETGKAYLHDFLDVKGRPVLVVVACKHFPSKQDSRESEQLCVFLIEKALSKLSDGKEEILGIVDLRGFTTENGDIMFLKFLIDVFYTYYPKRVGQVLFVDAPFVFQPIWQIVKPWLKSYASLVRFCSVETVRNEYFTEETVPADFRE